MNKSVGGEHADKSPEDRDDHTFDENLNKNILVTGADGFADADFADAFRNAGQHDIHNADAADEQTDGSDHSAAQAGVADEGADILGPIFLRAKRKILDAFVGAHEDILHLLNGRGELVHA